MKVHFQIRSEETGILLLRQRRIAKALRWWLRENGITYQHEFFFPRSFYLIRSEDLRTQSQISGSAVNSERN
ncbi:MAG TPA: hypothetical protein PLV06_08535 [Bacteroidales bacterium]|nr:hypothetical protein [Bacteroidales bacterium]HPJ58729.1 hypothetical protein [Bacteroidales bacterium]HPR12416.1 hypothetical protein [Bacteroidales bacterium]HRW86755.1 hypothetical protein [Bacteroidales bacterium]